MSEIERPKGLAQHGHTTGARGSPYAAWIIHSREQPCGYGRSVALVAQGRVLVVLLVCTVYTCHTAQAKDRAPTRWAAQCAPSTACPGAASRRDLGCRRSNTTVAATFAFIGVTLGCQAQPPSHIVHVLRGRLTAPRGAALPISDDIVGRRPDRRTVYSGAPLG